MLGTFSYQYNQGTKLKKYAKISITVHVNKLVVCHFGSFQQSASVVPVRAASAFSVNFSESKQPMSHFLSLYWGFFFVLGT